MRISYGPVRVSLLKKMNYARQLQDFFFKIEDDPINNQLDYVSDVVDSMAKEWRKYASIHLVGRK